MPRPGQLILAAVSFALMAAPSSQAVDLRNVLNGYSLTSWGLNDGLPSSEVLAISQDQDGFLWLGTDTGLVRFDGTRFVRWSGATTPRSIRALLFASRGDLWVGLGEDGGVQHYTREGPGRLRLVREYGLADGLAAGAVRSLAIDRDGTVWAGHLGGLFRLSGDRWSKWTAAGLEKVEVHALLVDRKGRLLVGTPHGILVSRPPDYASFELDAAGATRRDPVLSISVDNHGGIWRTDGLHGFQGRIDGRRVSAADIGRGQRLVHDSAGYLWVGTGGQGLWRVNRDPRGKVTVEHSTVTTGLLGNGVTAIFEDREGNIWVGTLDGLNRFTKYIATPIQGLGLVSGVEVSPHGIWVLTAESLFLIDPASTSYAAIPKYRGEVMAMHADERGHLWMSTAEGLWRFDQAGRLDGPLPAGRLDAIHLIASDRRGGLWLFDVQRGLHRLADGQLTSAPLPDDLRRTALAWMDTARDGTLWLATADGRLVSIGADGRSAIYDREDGLDAGMVRAILVDDEGTLWLGAAKGLVRFEDGRFSTVPDIHGHAMESMTGLIVDGAGQTWAGLRSGLLRVPREDLHRRMTASEAVVPLVHISKADGLAGSPRWYGHRGIVRDAWNRLWMVTSRGLSLVDPENIADPKPVEASVDTVVVDGHTFSEGIPELPAGTRRLDVQFGARSLTSPSITRFRYRLDGFDTEWVEAGPRQHASYTNLAPGDYRFNVMATNTDGTWPAHAALWTFTVHPMFYQTRAFLALTVLAILGLVALVWRLHLKRVRDEMSILLAERARLAREIHDTLLQGLFGVALRCDAIAAEAGSTAPHIQSQMLDLRRGVEQYVREARQSILGLRSPALDRLGLAEALRTTGERLTAGTPMTFAFEVVGRARRCPAAAEEHLLRIGQEAITNAVRHAKADAVGAVLRYTSDEIQLRVSDSGQGFDIVAASQTSGLGLENIRERAAAAGGMVRIHSRTGHGTDIDVTVPYEPAAAGA